MASSDTDSLSWLTSQELRIKLRALARSKGFSLSEWVRLALESQIQKDGEQLGTDFCKLAETNLKARRQILPDK